MHYSSMTPIDCTLVCYISNVSNVNQCTMTVTLAWLSVSIHVHISNVGIPML